MELKKESDAQLLDGTKSLIHHINEKTMELLERLREIERRKLHVERGYPSLFAFVTEELGFSAAAAMRRINSMRLLRELPEVKAQISTGALNLTTVSQAQQFFKKESYSREAKLELLTTLENKSTREVEKELVKRSPEVRIPDKARPVSVNQTEVKFIADDQLVQKLEKLKALKSHSVESLNELFNAMADLCLEKWEPKTKAASPKEIPRKAKISGVPGEVASPTPAPKRYVSRNLKAKIYARDEGKCQYKNPVTGKRCEARHFLQLDHVEPFALGGETTEANLRLYCSAHNQLRAAKTFGEWGLHPR